MSYLSKKTIGLFFLIVTIFTFSFSVVLAQDPDPNVLPNTQSQGGDTNSTYKLLEPLGTPNGKLTEFTTGDPCPFVRYLNIVIEIFLGICAVLAMIMIIAGGFEYVTSELPSFKKNGKERITNAVFGFIIALAAFVLLNTVNPKLLDLCPKIPQAVLNIVPGDSNAGPFVPLSKESLQELGVDCPGSGGKDKLVDIAKSFKGKVKYSNDPRNVIQGGSILIDCSSFVKQVYACAGMDFNGGATAEMFGGQGQISISGTKVNGTDELQVGDLIGWMMGESGPGQGHVVMYIGDGKFIEMTGSGILIRSLDEYAGRYKHIIKVY